MNVEAGPLAPQHRSPGRPRSLEADRAILEAIVDILVERGYREVTIEGVAARAGVAKTTIYRRWPAKAEMVVEAIAALKKDCTMQDACATDTVACALVGMLSSLSSSRVAKILTGLAVEMPHNEELAQAVREGLLRPNREVVFSILRRGVETGELRPGTDLEVIADMLVGPLLYRLLFSGGDIGPELVQATVDLLLTGISA